MGNGFFLHVRSCLEIIHYMTPVLQCKSHLIAACSILLKESVLIFWFDRFSLNLYLPHSTEKGIYMNHSLWQFVAGPSLICYFKWLLVGSFNPLENMLVKLDHCPNFRGEHKEHLSCHHLGSNMGVEPNIGGFYHQNGWFISWFQPYEQMDDLGGKNHNFWKHPIWTSVDGPAFWWCSCNFLGSSLAPAPTGWMGLMDPVGRWIYWQTNIAGWNITIFNRKYILKRSIFQPAMLDYRSVIYKICMDVNDMINIFLWSIYDSVHQRRTLLGVKLHFANMYVCEKGSLDASMNA